MNRNFKNEIQMENVEVGLRMNDVNSTYYNSDYEDNQDVAMMLEKLKHCISDSDDFTGGSLNADDVLSQFDL